MKVHNSEEENKVSLALARYMQIFSSECRNTHKKVPGEHF